MMHLQSRRKITYLGYEVNVEGIRPSKDHTDAIRNYPIPKNAEQVHSKRTTDAESKYSSYELECLAIVNSLKRFYVYLHGLKFKILTDCDSLRWTLSKKDIVPRIMKWNTFEQILGLEHYRPEDKGDKTTIIDKGNAVLRVKKWNEWKKLTFYVPEEMEQNVIRTTHEDTAHLGVEKVTEYTRETYWFPNMKEKIKAYIDNCLKCIVYNPKYGPRKGLLHNIDKGNKPFNTLRIDHLGPLEKSKQYHRHILVTIDAFSIFIKLFPCKGTTSCETVIHLQNYFIMYSRPQRIISDRGTCFTSAEFKRFIDGNNIKHILIATGVPRANGQVEVINMITQANFCLVYRDELRQILLDSYGNERHLEEARNEAEENIN
ncbi:hypothetical protein Trydic_g9565 [Trypoxylus dichotomus]